MILKNTEMYNKENDSLSYHESLCIHNKRRMLLRGRRCLFAYPIAIRYNVNINVTGFLLVVYE